MRGTRVNIPAPRPRAVERIERFKGMRSSVDPTQLDFNQSPDMLNFLLDEEGAPNKRTGYLKVFSTLGVGEIHGLFEYIKADGTTVKLLAHSTKLYTWTDAGVTTEIHTGKADARTHFFTFDDKCFILDGTNYLEYDGSTVQNVDPYIPNVRISTPPAGGGTADEDFNLIGAGFTQKFSGDGTSTTYQLTVDGLDATAITITVGSSSLVEDTDFTANRTDGTIDFSAGSAPHGAPASGTNNVVVSAFKTVSGNADKIRTCTGFKIFGGSNDTRVFLWGSNNNNLYRSDVFRPHYFPENSYQRVGSDATKIQGMTAQYDYAVIHKEYSSWSTIYQNNSGTVTFPVKPLNDSIGCIASGSLQIIENNPVTLTRDGVYMLVGGSVRDERNFRPISEDINKGNIFIDGLLDEANLEDAESIDYDNKYWLALNGNVYVMDYTQIDEAGNRMYAWLPQDNIPASCFMESDGRLYFGDSTNGIVYKFSKDGETSAYQDEGSGISYRWRSKIFAFDLNERLKMIERVFFSIKPATATSAKLYFVTNQGQSALANTTTMNLFDFNNMNFAQFLFILSSFPQVTMTKIKAKKIVYFQILFEGDDIDESLGILSVEIKWRPMAEVK